MSVLASRPTLRWILPAAALSAVIVAGTAGRTLVQSTSDALPERSPQQLLMDVAQAQVGSLSGTIVQKSNLGLPSLPQLNGTDLNTMINGNHTVKIWYDGPNKVRVAAQNPDSTEQDLVRNGTNLWTYNSDTKKATHRTLSGDEAKKPSASPSLLPSGGLSGSVSDLLAKFAPTTKISTDGTAKVAGRSAYELVIQPRDSKTRVAQIRIAIDGTEHIPLQVQVYATGSNSPVFEAGFTNVSFDKPDAAEFTFKPPAGTTVTEVKPGDKSTSPHGRPGDKAKADKAQEPKVVGAGWSSVVFAKGVDTTITLPSDATAEQRKAAAAATKFLDSQPKVKGAWGSGRLIDTKLFSILITDDGRVYAGAVAPSTLYDAAAQTK